MLSCLFVVVFFWHFPGVRFIFLSESYKEVHNGIVRRWRDKALTNVAKVLFIWRQNFNALRKLVTLFHGILNLDHDMLKSPRALDKLS